MQSLHQSVHPLSSTPPSLTLVCPSTKYHHRWHALLCSHLLWHSHTILQMLWISVGKTFSAFRNLITNHCFMSPAMSRSVFVSYHKPATWHAALKFEGHCWYTYIFTRHHYILYATSKVETKFGGISFGTTLIVRILNGISWMSIITVIPMYLSLPEYLNLVLAWPNTGEVLHQAWNCCQDFQHRCEPQMHGHGDESPLVTEATSLH